MIRKQLWAPWRMEYIARISKRSSGCLFCQKGRSKSDARNLVLQRVRTGFSILNRYPYSNGHLMVAPYRHVGSLERLTDAEWLDLLKLIQAAMHRLDQKFLPQGYNLGINLGRSAGAGIPGHLHLHVVPRWKGDTNFMPVLSDTRVVSQSLESAYRQLKGTGSLRRSKKARS